MIKLFLDDERTPYDSTWKLARNNEQAKEIVNRAVAQGERFCVSLDHDLGGTENSKEFVVWLVENNFIPEAACVHSANPVGAWWLQQCLKNDFPHPIPSC